MLDESGISKKEQEQHPQTMVDIIKFYEKNPDDEVFHKFDHAQPDKSAGSKTSPGGTSPVVYPPLTAVTSPPVSPRFPQNHEGSFENPRAPPPIPRAATSPNLSSPTISSITSRVQIRPAPKPQSIPITNLVPVRPAPQPPVSKEAASKPSTEMVTNPLARPIPEPSLLPPENQRTPQTNSNANGNLPPQRIPPAATISPTQYKQQEQATAAAQQALTNKL